MKKHSLKKKLRRLFIYLVWKLLPSCKEFVPVLSESLDKKLSLHQRIIVKMHLAACPSCVRYLKQIKFLSEASRKSDEKILLKRSDAKLSDEARQRLKNILKTSIGTFALIFYV